MTHNPKNVQVLNKGEVKNMQKDYTLYKQTIINSKGCPEDDSITKSTKTQFFLIPKDQDEAFNESCAEDYGYQDYNYRVSYDEIAEFYEEEIQMLKVLFEKVKKVEE